MNDDVQLNWQEEYYDCGRPPEQYKPDDIQLSNFPFGFEANFQTALAICQRYRFCTKLFAELCTIHHRVNNEGFGKDRIDQPMTGEPLLLYEYKFISESLVFQMRRTLDTFVQLAEIMISNRQDRVVETLEVGGIASLLKSGGNSHLSYQIVMGNGRAYAQDPTEYARTLNDLFNAMKHHAAYEESHSMWANNSPPIIAFYVKDNNPNNGLKLLNHSAHQLIMGYQDWVARVTQNLQRLQDDSS